VEDRRKYRRFYTILNAQYFLRGKKEGWKECVTTDICHKGVGIKLNTTEKITIGSPIALEIFAPTEYDPIDARGVVKRLGRDGNGLMSGIEFNNAIDDTKWAKLCLHMMAL